MKLVKLSLVALSFGLFAASCGETTTTEETTTDSSMIEAPMTEPEPMPMDTTGMSADTVTTDQAPVQ